MKIINQVEVQGIKGTARLTPIYILPNLIFLPSPNTMMISWSASLRVGRKRDDIISLKDGLDFRKGKGETKSYNHVFKPPEITLLDIRLDVSPLYRGKSYF